MRKKSFRNYDINDSKTTFTQPSLTVPGQTLSLRELLERYVVSGTVETHRGVYDMELPENFEKMDVFEKLDMAAQLRQGIANAQAAADQPPPPAPPHDAPTLTPTPPPPIIQKDAE